MYNYYRKAAPKVDVAPVALALVLGISIIQYLSQRSQHRSAIRYFTEHNEKIRLQAKLEAERRGLLKKSTKKARSSPLSPPRLPRALLLACVHMHGPPSLGSPLHPIRAKT